MIIDACLVAFSIYFSYLLRFDFNIPAQFIETLGYVIITSIVFFIISFYIHKIYKRFWQYASVGDLIAIFKGTLLGIVSFFIFHQALVYVINMDIVVPRSIYLFSLMTSFMTVGGSRFFWRLFRDSYIKIQPYHKRALIVGAGTAGTMLAKDLKQKESEYYPIAFVDDDVTKRNMEIIGVPVVGSRKDIEKLAKQYNVEMIIIAMPSASRATIAETIEYSKKVKCKIKMIPAMHHLLNGKVKLNTIRDISVEDLLGREPVRVNLEEISSYVTGKTVLITGAGGSIGSELSRQCANYNPKTLLLLGHGENSIYLIDMELRKQYPELDIRPIIADIQDRPRIEQIFNEYKPEVVFHAAAHKHVPMMESNPAEAVKNNIFGTKNVAECSDQYGVERFVLISSDKAVNPTNVMGATKRVAELILLDLNQRSITSFAAVRFGNVLGSRGSVIPLFKKQIAEGGPVTVTHPEMVRYFMTIPEAVQLVIQAGAFADGGEVFVLDMGEPVKINDLACDLIRLCGFEPNVDIHVAYSGIRPGEKLFEELLTSEEGTTATKHDRIFVGKDDTHSKQLYNVMEQLQYTAYNAHETDSRLVTLLLKELVPTFKTNLIDENDKVAESQLLNLKLSTTS